MKTINIYSIIPTNHHTINLNYKHYKEYNIQSIFHSNSLKESMK